MGEDLMKALKESLVIEKRSCEVCGRVVSVDPAGRLRRHGYQAVLGYRRCPGSDRMPERETSQ